MDISGSYTFDAPPARVWALLMDPVVDRLVHSWLRIASSPRDRIAITHA